MKSIRSLTTTSALRGAALAGALAMPGFAQAESVNLISADGTVDIVGDFVDFVDNTYVIRTALGELRLSAKRVRCEGDACPDVVDGGKVTADVVLAGSETLGLGVMPLLLEGYAGVLDADMAATRDGTNLVAELVGDQGFGDELGSYLVQSSGSSAAFDSLIDSSASIGMAARRILPAEARALRDAGAGNMIDPTQEHIVAVDSIVVVVNPENGIDTLTMAQIGQIYAGQITNWSQVGGRDVPITVIGHPQDTSAADVFYNAVMGDQANWRFTPDLIVAEDNNNAAALVNQNPGAIGFVGYAFQRGAKAISLVNACGLTMSPNAFNARTEEYALQRRMYLYNREDVAPDAKAFLDFIKSSDADALIRKAGFIDLGVASQEQPLDGDRARSLLDPNADAYEGNVMREMLGTMIDYERLSTTFRFRTGSSKLDERGAVDMERLIAHLQRVPEGSKVMLVGFTDDVGAFDSIRQLSEERAAQVLEDLRTRAGERLAGVELTHRGFGEVAPTACNQEDRGRAINRRVEVWIQAAR